jgi:hypothetical protein
VYEMNKKEKSVCLSETQMEHIIDAARDEPKACPKAKAWVNKFRPARKEGNIILENIDRKLEKKAKAILRDFQRWF